MQWGRGGKNSFIVVTATAVMWVYFLAHLQKAGRMGREKGPVSVERVSEWQAEGPRGPGISHGERNEKESDRRNKEVHTVSHIPPRC